MTKMNEMNEINKMNENNNRTVVVEMTVKTKISEIT